MTALLAAPDAAKPGRVEREAREDARGGLRGRAEMLDQHLGKHVPEIRRYGEIATFETLLDAQSRPRAIDVTAFDAAADHEHGVAVPVVGAAAAILRHRPSELRHRQDDGVRHSITEVLGKSRDATR